jgi:hypothetical protein
MSYTINTDQPTTFADFSDARVAADQAAIELGREVQVTTEIAGEPFMAYATSPFALRKVATGAYFPPNTRIENPTHAAPVFQGMVPAYVRTRIEATVYRMDDKAGWRVYDGRTGNFEDVANTKQACALTSAMRLGRML